MAYRGPGQDHDYDGHNLQDLPPGSGSRVSLRRLAAAGGAASFPIHDAD